MLVFCSVIGEHSPRQLRKNLVIDEKLIEKIGNGDKIAFEKLYRLTEKVVYAYILSILKNHYAAQDVMQDTYLRIRSAAHLYTPQGKPLAWIFSIARNLSLMRIRTENRYINTEFSYLENNPNFSYLTNNEDKLVLQTALKILNEEERKIILLHAVSGLKHREIASSLSMPLSTVLSKYHRGLKKLRQQLLVKEGRS